MIRTLTIRPPVVRESTGERIRRLREMSGRSIRQFAEDAGVAHTVVWGAEHDHAVYAHSLDALAQELGVSMDYLWSGEGAS